MHLCVSVPVSLEETLEKIKWMVLGYNRRQNHYFFLSDSTEFLGDLKHLSSTSISVSLHLLNTKPLYKHERNIMRNCIIMMKRYGKVNNILILLDCDFQLLPCETPIRCLQL